MNDAAPLHVFVVAGEESGDRLGGPLMRALRAKLGDKVRFSGVGGGEMTAQGLHSLFELGELAIMGVSAIPRRLPAILRRTRETADAAIAAKPDILVIIDSPEFTHRVAKRVRARAPSIPIVDYVSPTVWAWRPHRARAMRRYIDHVLALLPFEPAVHVRLGGPPCTFVGHPIAERIDELRPNAAEQVRRDTKPAILLVMPGSRNGELDRMLPVFAQALELIGTQAGPLEVVVPTVPHLAERVRRETSAWKLPVRVVADPKEKNAAFRTAFGALAKSGTGTLELAVAGIPTVAAYKVSRVEEMIARALVKTPGFILANLILGEKVVPELMQWDCTPERIAAALLPLLRDGPERRVQLEAFARLDGIMEIGRASPSERAAAVVIELAKPANGARLGVALPPSAA